MEGGKKSGYYPSENGGIDKTRVAITADRTNTMIPSERNFFFFSCSPPVGGSLPRNSLDKSRRNKRRTFQKGSKGGLTDGWRPLMEQRNTYVMFN